MIMIHPELNSHDTTGKARRHKKLVSTSCKADLASHPAFMRSKKERF